MHALPGPATRLELIVYIAHLVQEKLFLDLRVTKSSSNSRTRSTVLYPNIWYQRKKLRTQSPGVAVADQDRGGTTSEAGRRLSANPAAQMPGNSSTDRLQPKKAECDQKQTISVKV
jgi:hypothetical protein